MHKNQSSIIFLTTPSLDRSDNVSGVASVVREIISGLSSTNWISRTFIVGKKDLTRRRLKWALQQITIPFLLLFALYRERPRIVHINGPLNGLAILRETMLLSLARIYTTRVIYHLHGGLYVSRMPTNAFLAALIRFMLSRAAAIIVLGPQEADYLVTLYGARRENIHVLPNAVAIPQHTKNFERSGQLNVLSIGRLSIEKGLEVLADALEQNCTPRTGMTLHMYGAGPLEQSLIPRLQLAMGEAFFFGGVANEQERNAALAWADVIVMPSLNGEGLPMTLLEAMASGVVPIATADGMIPNVLNHGSSGFVIEKNSPSAIMQAIDLAAKSKISGELEEMAARALRIIVRDHSISSYIDKLDRIYCGV